MLAQCVEAIAKAAGRALSQNELDGIEERMLSSMQTLARKDPSAWRMMSRDQRYTEAATLANRRYREDVAAAQTRTIRDMQTRTRELRAVDSFKPGLQGQLSALRQRLTLAGNFRGGDIPLEQKIKGVYQDFTRELDGGALKGRFFGLIQNPAEQRAIMLAIFGKDSGNPEINALGKQVRDVVERARVTANDAGIPIHYLDDYMPRAWAWEKIGADQQHFIKRALEEINPDDFINRDGSPMSPDQLRRFVTESAETLGTNGANKRGEKQGSGFSGGVGSSRNAPRQLKFRDADAEIRMAQEFGSADNVLSLLDHHFHGMARDIATARAFGRDADRFVPQLINRAFAADARAGLNEAQLKDLEKLRLHTVAEFNAMRNPGSPGALPLWAQVSNTVRGVVGATLLGGSTLAAVPDIGMAIAYGREIGLTKRAILANMKEGLNPSRDNRNYIRRLGITAQTLQDGTHRFGAGELSNQFTRFLNHGVHVLSVLRMWDRGQTHGIAASLMDGLGEWTRKDHASLDPKDQQYLASRGVTADHYAAWQAAELDKGPEGNHTMLTPDAIYSIPDDKLAPISEKRIAAVSKHFKAAVDKLRERNATEVQWIDGRVNKLAELRDKARASVAQLRAKGTVKEALAEGEAEALAEALDAKVAVAEITLKLDRTLAAEKSADRIRGIMADVAKAERSDGSTAAIHESGKPENAAKAALNSGMRLGEQLGAKRARALYRLRNAEAKVEQIRREGKRRADKAAQQFADSIDKRTTELNQFINASRERMDKRSEWIAEYEKAGGNLVAEDIRRLRSEAAQHLLALTLSESQIGARGGSGNSIRDNLSLHITPDNAGTIMGQMARWLLFLKQTPLGIFRTHMLDVPGGMNDWRSAWSYRARLVAMQASLGALALTLKTIALGQDPEDLLTKKGAAKVAIASGGFGMYGDFLFGDSTEHRNNGLVKLAGPGATFLDDLIHLYGDTENEAGGESSTRPGQYGAKLLKFARNYAAPFSRLWYAKAAFNHMIYQQQMEKLSPGYNARTRQRMARQGQTSWWQPGEMAPDRAPDLGAAVGQPAR